MAVLLLALLPVPPKLSKSTKGDKYPRQVNADTRQDLFKFIFAPLQHAALDGVPIDCADWKVRRCFPILSAWVADHMENVTPHGLKSNVCPTGEVPAGELGTNIKNYRARDYARYERYAYENQFPGSKSDGTHVKFPGLGINLGQNGFHGLNRVSAPDLHTPDMLHTVCLGLFKHMMDLIQVFVMKHGRLQAFDDVCKALPPYPGFSVPKKAFPEVPQWQGKEMRNLGRCILGVLAVALRQPQSSQVIPFKHALGCVRALVDFSMMAQYRSHTSDTIPYMEHYLDQFHRMKGIFLEFRVTKPTVAKVDEQRREIRHQRTLMSQPVASSKRRQILDDGREEEHERRMALVHRESHFNFIKIHLLSHFSDHIRQFGNIPMYSMEFGELAHKEQIKDGWRRSNKADAARHIVHSYSRQPAIRMRLLTLKTLRRRGTDLSADVLQHLESRTSAVTTPVVRRKIPKGRREDVSNVLDFSKVSGLSLESICREFIRYSRHNLPTERQLSEDHAILQSLPV